MDEAERAFAESFRKRGLPGPASGSRVESFSPYVWSWLPMLVTGGSPGEELSDRTYLERVLPTLLDDLDVLVREREPGSCELLRVPDLANGLARGELLESVDRGNLERFRAAVADLPALAARQTNASTDVARHLRSAMSMLRSFGDVIDVELDLRDGRVDSAHVRLAAMATPGQLPSGFAAMIARLARLHGSVERRNAALAALDLGLLSTTEGDWPAQELRALYLECGGRSAIARWELALARRAAPLVPSGLSFDATSLVDIASGRPLAGEELDGRTLVLDFVTRGCGPCLEAVPMLQAFDADHAEIEVIAVVVGEAEHRSDVLEQIRDRGGRFTVAHDTASWASKLGVIGYPSYVVVTPEGRILRPFGLQAEPTHSFDDVVGTLVPGRWRFDGSR